jgi:hypothetical protein
MVCDFPVPGGPCTTNKSENFNYIDKTNELDQIKRNIAKDTNEYKKIVRQGTQEINNPKYQGM